VLSAAAFGEAAREDESLGHDVYTYFLLEALSAGDRDGDGAVTISEAHDYARERTWRFTQGQQRPASESTILGLDPIVLRGQRQRDGLPVIYSYSRAAEGISVRLSGQQKGVLPGGFAAAPGKQRLELVDSSTGGLLYAGTIELERGERVELSRLIPPAPKLEIHLGGGVFVPLSQGARDGLPVAPMVGVRLRGRNWPAARLTSELSVSMVVNGGTTATIDHPLPYQLLGVHLQLGLGRTFELSRVVYVEPQLRVGNIWLSRHFSGASNSDESLRAITLSPAVELGAAPSEAFRVSLRFEVPLFYGRLEGSRTLQAVGQLGLLAGYSF
jgi:hypothetical protein